MKEIKGSILVDLVKKQQIQNGKVFNVFETNSKKYIGQIGVIKTTIAFIEFKDYIPGDLYSDNYLFIETDE